MNPFETFSVPRIVFGPGPDDVIWGFGHYASRFFHISVGRGKGFEAYLIQRHQPNGDDPVYQWSLDL